MKVVFADASYFIALLEQNDSHHEAARLFSIREPRALLTTSAIILELGAYFSRAVDRQTFMAILESLSRSRAEIVHVDQALHDRGIKRFADRPDKDWSLADCISFIVMEDRQITEAATTDAHFEQAGFISVLRGSAQARR